MSFHGTLSKEGGENMNFDKMMKECMKPHALVHMVTGAGLGMLVMSFVPSLYMMGWVAGAVVVVVGIVLDMMVQGK